MFEGGDYIDELVKSLNPVTPAKAGVQKCLKLVDSGSARNEKRENSPFYETIYIKRSNSWFFLCLA